MAGDAIFLLSSRFICLDRIKAAGMYDAAVLSPLIPRGALNFFRSVSPQINKWQPVFFLHNSSSAAAFIVFISRSARVNQQSGRFDSLSRNIPEICKIMKD